MEVINLDLRLDFKDNNSLKVLNIQQFDNRGKIIQVSLTNNGKSVNIASTDSTVTLMASTNGIITASSVECEIKNNKVLIPITEELSQIAGKEYCVLKITKKYGNSNAVHTSRFCLSVGKNPVNNEMPHVLLTSDIVKKVQELEYEVKKVTSVVSGMTYPLINDLTMYSISGIAEESKEEYNE